MINMLKMGMPVILPGLAIIAAELVFLRTLRKRDGSVRPFEIGVFYSGLVVIYALYPLVNYAANGFTYSPLADSRLFRAQPSPSEAAPIYWYYFLFLASFALAYCILRGRHNLDTFTPANLGKRTFWILVTLYLVIGLFFIFVRVYYKIEEPETYSESYLQYKGLPLLVQQMVNHLRGIGLTIRMLLMAYMLFDYRKYKYYALAWLAIEFLGIGLFGIGARTALFVLVLSFVITYDLAVRRLSIAKLALVSVTVLFLFIGLGIVRWMGSSSPDVQASILTSNNEFDGVFANAYDVRELAAAGDTKEIFPRLYFVDFTNLVPQQLLPFQKIDLEAWYVGTFYSDLDAIGGGYAFGVIPEAIVGLGRFDILWRGALLGWIFALLQKHLLTNRKSFWSYGFYLWTMVLSFHTIRTSTFALLPRAFFQFLTVFVTVKVASSLFGMRRRPRPGITPMRALGIDGAS